MPRFIRMSFLRQQNLKEMLRQRNMVLNTSQAGSQVLGGPQGLQQQQQLASTTSATQQLGSAALSGQTAASANPGRVGTPNAQTATSALGSSVGSIPGRANDTFFYQQQYNFTQKGGSLTSKVKHCPLFNL